MNGHPKGVHECPIHQNVYPEEPGVCVKLQGPQMNGPRGRLQKPKMVPTRRETHKNKYNSAPVECTWPKKTSLSPSQQTKTLGRTSNEKSPKTERSLNLTPGGPKTTKAWLGPISRRGVGVSENSGKSVPKNPILSYRWVLVHG